MFKKIALSVLVLSAPILASNVPRHYPFVTGVAGVKASHEVKRCSTCGTPFYNGHHCQRCNACGKYHPFGQCPAFNKKK